MKYSQILLLTVSILPSVFAFAAEDEGAKIYNTNCASCHGVNMDANTPVAKALNPAPAHLEKFTKNQIVKVLSTGKTLEGKPIPVMAAYPTSLKDKEREQVADYIVKRTGKK